MQRSAAGGIVCAHEEVCMGWKGFVLGIVTGGMLVVGAGIAGLVTTGGPLSDIRPESVSTTADPEAEARGRELLAAMLEAHGGRDAWLAHETWTATLRDTWLGPMVWMSPWPEAAPHLRLTMRPGTFDNQATFLDGPLAGHRWGIADGRTWTRAPDGPRVWQQDDAKAFILPTTQYFLEAPLRLPEAHIVRYAGQETVRGETLEVVYVTWGRVTANPDYDQYKVFIDPETHRLRALHYTVRDMMNFVVGAATYEDLEETGGIVVATRITIVPDPGVDPASEQEVLHRFEVEAITFDAESVATR